MQADRGHRPLAWASRSSASRRTRVRAASPRADDTDAGGGRTRRPTGRNHDMAHGKKYLEAAKLVDRDARLRARRGGRARQADVDRQVRRDGRGPPPARRRPAPRRPDGPRHGRPAERHRQGRPGRRLRPGREGPGGAPRRRRRGRRARTSSRRSRPAGSSSTSRSRRPTRWAMVGRLGKILGRRGLMPNPKAGHDHLRPRPRDPRGQGRPGRVQGRQGRDRPRRRRQERASSPRRSSPTWPPSSTRSTGPSRPARRASTSGR